MVNFIDVLYTLHSHFNHESTDFTGYYGKRVNFMPPTYLHVRSNRDIEHPSKKEKKKNAEKNFPLSRWKKIHVFSRSSFELVNYSRFVFYPTLEEKWKKIVTNVFPLIFVW